MNKQFTSNPNKAFRTMQERLLAISRATIGYRKGRTTTPVVTDIEAALYKGELVALLGRNGAGKSTLLRTLISGLPPLAGEITSGGCSIDRLSQVELAKLVSVVLTDNSVPGLKVHELVAIGRTPHTNFMGRLTKEDKRVVENAMETMRIAHLANRDVASLSDGERQKCFIAKALAQETPILLLDEPTAFLDYPSKLHLYATLKELAVKEEKAVLVSTHDLDLALKSADKIWFIDGGRLYQDTPDELVSGGVMERFMKETSIAK